MPSSCISCGKWLHCRISNTLELKYEMDVWVSNIVRAFVLFCHSHSAVSTKKPLTIVKQLSGWDIRTGHGARLAFVSLRHVHAKAKRSHGLYSRTLCLRAHNDYTIVKWLSQAREYYASIFLMSKYMAHNSDRNVIICTNLSTEGTRLQALAESERVERTRKHKRSTDVNDPIAIIPSSISQIVYSRKSFA